MTTVYHGTPPQGRPKFTHAEFGVGPIKFVRNGFSVEVRADGHSICGLWPCDLRELSKTCIRLGDIIVGKDQEWE